MKRSICGTIVLILLTCLSSGCINHENTIYGTWEGIETNSTITFYGNQSFEATFYFSNETVNNTSTFSGTWYEKGKNSGEYALWSKSWQTIQEGKNSIKVTMTQKPGEAPIITGINTEDKESSANLGEVRIEEGIMYGDKMKYIIILKEGSDSVLTEVEFEDNFRRKS